MSEQGDIPLTQNSTPDTRPPCSIISIIPTIGMSSCRGRAEAFARSLSSKLRTLGSQANEEGVNAEDEPIINGSNTNTWMNAHEAEQTVTDLQPLRHESDSFFDFDCELESPGSPVDECEYLRLIETASNTPHNSTAESGYACASVASSHSSTDGPYFDAAAGSSSNIQVAVAEQLLVTTQPLTATTHSQDTTDYTHVNGTRELLTNGEKEQQDELEAAEQQQQPQQLQEDESQLQAQILSELQQHSDSLKIADKAEQEQTTLLNGHMEQMEKQLLQLTEEEKEITTTTTAATATATEEAEAAVAAAAVPQTEVPECSQDEVDNKRVVESALALNVDLAQLEQAKQDAATAVAAAAASATAGKAQEKSSHGTDTTDDEDDCRPQRVRRCSSLKTGKTPPGTPGRKKIVRFADVLGLDLADVKTFLDEIPTIPKSAFEDLEILDTEPPMQLGPKSDKLLMPLFQQPGGLVTFLDAVREKQVSLENAAVSDSINQTISGSVRVRNLDFHKSVHVRYSLDGWRSFADLQANYVENSCDGFSDKFTFVLFGNSLHVGQRLEFAVRFQCKGQQFWDNNYGANYCFQCLPTSTHTASPASMVTGAVSNLHTSNLVGMLSPTAGDAWCSSFY
ncbi:glycogen-binding subunit 76A [Drosophila busckii]|uniref:glycogen-binding subunit 76A n=1 Tax=Drosophila busckii TaxID=30019 RepID=UPI001432E0FB|nr:glycogen-binding subunit 76A [Drosophila busckii]XP_033149300.1 glycogen-binding subunit 76A [Drosophila busckii]XP_033149301.1 glycogen-binding subunit 76A [Drosophila busckii]